MSLLSGSSSHFGRGSMIERNRFSVESKFTNDSKKNKKNDDLKKVKITFKIDCNEYNKNFVECHIEIGLF